MRLERASGVLLHPSSLPGPLGIGSVGKPARHLIDFLAATGCTYWQVLPLGPTGYGNSPYQSPSALATNPDLISLEDLVPIGLLSADALSDVPAFAEERVEYTRVRSWRGTVLTKAFDRFRGGGFTDLEEEFAEFRSSTGHWLDDYTLFGALSAAMERPWPEWPEPLIHREPAALSAARDRLRNEIDEQAFQQWLFFRQWQGLRRHAHDAGVQVIGDAPIFIAHDSADVWSHRELFLLDETGRPSVVAGVPPDQFSATGQLWGNPLYRWEEHAAEGYRWWIARLSALIELVDVVRIDHFRGFVDYWEVPGDAETAEVGRWVDGPGIAFFEAVREALGSLPIVAEDLALPNPAVPELRDRLAIPGMQVAQHAFTGVEEGQVTPERYPVNCVAYTGTHDNDTTVGWFNGLSAADRRLWLDYLRTDGADIAWDLARAVWRSPAGLAIAPLQDFLRLGSEARMNTPGHPDDNWEWRVRDEALTDELTEAIGVLNNEADRHKDQLTAD